MHGQWTMLDKAVTSSGCQPCLPRLPARSNHSVFAHTAPDQVQHTVAGRAVPHQPHAPVRRHLKRQRVVIVRAEDRGGRQAVRDTKSNTLALDDDSCVVLFKTRCKVGVDEVMKVVGNVKELGGWNVEAAPVMSCSDGENWFLETMLPPGNYDFKCIKYKAGKSGGMGVWERGDDRNIEVSVGVSGMDVSCEFGDTSKTQVVTSDNGESLDMMRGSLTVPEAADIRVRDMEKTIGTLKAEMQRTESDRARLKDELNKVVVQAIAADQELNRLQAEVQSLMTARGGANLQAQINATSSVVRDVDREVSGLRKALEEREFQLKKQQERYETQIREMERAIKGTEEDRSRLKEQLNNMVTQAVQAEEALASLQSEVRELQRNPRGEEMSRSMMAREDALKRSEDELNKIKKELESKAQDINIYTEKLEQKIIDMENERRRYNDEVAQLRKQLEDKKYEGQKEEDAKMRQIRELQEQLQRTESQRAALKTELNTMVNEAINADKELGSLQAEVQRLLSAGTTNNSQYERTVRLLEEEKSAALNKVSRITAQLEDKELEFQRYTAQLRDTVSTLEEDKKKLRDEVEQLQRKLQEQSSKYQSGQTEERRTIERLESELKRLDKDRAFLREEMSGMSEVARMAEQELMRLQKEVEEINNERSSFSSTAEQEVFRLQQMVEERDKEMDRVRQQADQRVKSLEKQLEAAEDDRSRIKAELSSVVMQAMEADKELNKLQSEVKSFVATGGENNPAVARLREDVMALQKEKGIAIQDVSRLTEKLERTEREIQAAKQGMQRTVEGLQRQLLAAEDERSRLRKEMSEMAVKAVAVEKYQAQMAALEQDRAMLGSKIKELERRVLDKDTDLKTATASLRESVRRLEEEKADSVRDASILRQRLAEKETELKRMKDTLQNTIRSLEDEKATAMAEVTKLKKAILALESEKNVALREVARLKTELEFKETELKTKTQQIRLLEQEKAEVQRELNLLRASINEGTTEVQKMIAKDRKVQEEIVKELQTIKNTLGLAPSGRSSPLYEALTNAEVKSDFSSSKTAAVVDRLLQPAKNRAAGLRDAPRDSGPNGVANADAAWFDNFMQSMTGSSKAPTSTIRGPAVKDAKVSTSKTADKRLQPVVGDDEEVTAFQQFVLVAASIAIPTVVASEYTINATSCCGLPAGPYGLLGNLEALSYLTVLSIISWSIFRRLKGKQGLPQGPYGALPAVEGLSYAALIGGIVVISIQILGNGWVPGFLQEQSGCF